MKPSGFSQHQIIWILKEFYPGLNYDESGAITVKRSYGTENVQEIVELVLRFVLEGQTIADNGDTIDIEAESVCVHGDVVNAPEVLEGLHSALANEKIEVRSAIHRN